MADFERRKLRSSIVSEPRDCLAQSSKIVLRGSYHRIAYLYQPVKIRSELIESLSLAILQGCNPAWCGHRCEELLFLAGFLEIAERASR
jgi:hypothetical protein